MARQNFVIEKGLKIVDAGTNTGVEHIQGSGAPSMDAPVGSLYSDRDTGSHYQKVAAGAGSGNWKKLATTDDVTASIGTWRPENVVCVSSEVIIGAAFTRDLNASPFSDDDDNTVSNSSFVQGDYAILNGILFVVTAASLSGVTFDVVGVTPLAKDDTFVCRHYLPDPVDQENHAIVNFNGSVMVKIADADWGRADAIGLDPAYLAANGSITSADTVNDALEKLDGNQQDLITLSGVAQGAEDLGVFTGTTIADGQTVKAALQDLETAHEGLADDVGHLVTLSGVAVDSDDLGVFTGTTIADGQTVKAALQDLETASEAIADDVSHLVTLSGVAVDSDDLGVFTGDIIADGQTVKAALQDLETELVDTRDNVDDLITLSGLPENSTALDFSALASVSKPQLFNTDRDKVIGDDINLTVNVALSKLDAAISPLITKAFQISASDVSWKDLAEFPSDEGVCVKVVIMSMGFHPTTKISMVSLEALLMGQGQGANGTADYTSYAKLKIDEHNGSPVSELYDLEVRGFYDTVLGKVKLQVKATAATTVDKYLQYRIQPIGYDINW